LHEIPFSENILNLIGIGLEIIGFIIILPHIKRWLQKRILRLANEAEKEHPGAPLGIDESHEVVVNTVNIYWRKLENIGIPLVITGLAFQGLSLFIHNPIE